MDVSIVMFKADGTRRDFPIQREKLVIGRKNTSDLRIPLSSVSRQHCEIKIDGDQVKMRDLGSSNGTFHNDTRVQEAVLAAGDKLAVGPVVFTVVIDGQPSRIEPVRTVLSDAAGTDQSATVAPAVEEPRQITTKDELPVAVEDESHSPTVELDANGDDDDDDPIAALEALAAAEDGDENDDSDRLPSIELLELDDDDDRR